ncbi:MAG: N-acetylmuramoyl-L-alanine amidase [Pseudomonadota bacterium]
MNIISMPSPNFDERDEKDIKYIILHYTGMQSAEDAFARLCDQSSEVSAHYTVDEEGKIYQHVNEEHRAWHAGKSAWQNDHSLNKNSIGIEIVNPGHEFGYVPFPKEQINAVIDLCKKIQIDHDIEYVLGHSDVAPERKLDPGELFPWQTLAQNGIGEWPSISSEDMVKCGSMDIYTALKDFGYRADHKENALLAFQRHFVPEAFEKEAQGYVCSLTKGRLYALLASHLINSQ